MKTHFAKDSFKKSPINPVICFIEIQRNGHINFRTTAVNFQMVKNLMGNNDAILDEAPRYKGKLMGRNYSVQNGFHPVGKDFCDYFETEIA